jgi:hypothetical protein
MSTLEFAGLGCRRGAGESLFSWLRAGPLGVNAVGSHESAATLFGALSEAVLYCPACRVEESGRRRWYSRSEWRDPNCVICSVHDVPLVRCDAPPARLRGRRWPRALRSEFRALNRWTQGWSESASRKESNHANQPEVAVLRAILARTDPRMPHSRALAEGQWRLWVEGWPLPAGPLFPLRRQTMPTRQPDRLAAIETTHRVCLCLQSGVEPNWPPLVVRRRTLTWLHGRLHQLRPAWNEHICLCFISDD